jgi:hypothetical protein
MWRGVVHDISKLLPSEFIPYARYFYGNYPNRSEVSTAMKYEYTGLYRDEIEEQFDMSWLKHIHRNPHHWQYWILREDDGDTKLIPIPMIYIKEMIADWMGAGMAISGRKDALPWYETNKENIILHSDTRRIVEHSLHYISEVEEWNPEYFIDY